MRSHSTLRRLVLACGILAALAVPGAAAAQAQPGATDEQTLVELERAWNDAFYKKDIELLDSLLAEEFVATYDDGSLGDRNRELELSAAFNQRVISATQEDFTVRVYGDTGVVWFTLRLVGLRQGERAEVAFRYTDVWVRRDGRWQCVSTQSTRIGRR
ncbi:MAG: nuclear transport factor 2 family protein [Acidobacteria bacterium]|nr:nuclear transport factor 2 family protein [Acidobacteriota bacterium]